MIRGNILPLFFLFCATLSSPVHTSSTNISVILQHCHDYPECYESNIDQFSSQYYKSLVKLLSSGVNQFIWEYVSNREKEYSGKISLSCDKSLRHVWSSITKGQEWAFRSKTWFLLDHFLKCLEFSLFAVIESAGKLPPGFLESTVTSFGDYDECLAIESNDEENIVGQYCMTDIFPIGKDEDEHRKKVIYLKSLPLFKGSPFLIGLCLPAACSFKDISFIANEGKEFSSELISNLISVPSSVPICTQFER